MEDETVQLPNTQQAQPGVKNSLTPQQAAQQPPVAPRVLPKQPPSEGLQKGSKTKKIVKFFIFLPVLAIIAYLVFLAITYWNCTKTTLGACEISDCNFSLTGFNLTTEMKNDCCGNTKCELSETNLSCGSDCPSCDDDNECTKDSFDYDSQECTYEQIIAPCNLRPISLAPATPKDDYQIKIKLTSSSFDYAKAETNGEDIRFFNEDDQLLPYWIENWNKEGESVIWVKLGASGIDKIYMYYGYPSVSSASNGPAVFDFFEGFDYENESEILKVWSKHGSPTIELSDGIATIATSGTIEEHGGQYISRNAGGDVLLNDIYEMSLKRFSGGGYANHMANIGFISPGGGPIDDGNCWAVLRYNPSPDGGVVVFGGNHGGIAPPPIGSFNIIKIYHREGISYAYEPPATKVAEYSWPTEPPSGDYILLGGQTYQSGYGKASYDWIRIRKYFSIEPTAVLGDEEIAKDKSAIKEAYKK
jgi:hypothetical protein